MAEILKKILILRGIKGQKSGFCEIFFETFKLCFRKREKNLKNVMMNGKDLPWMKASRHLECKIMNESSSLRNDMMEKKTIKVYSKITQVLFRCCNNFPSAFSIAVSSLETTF